MKTSIKQTISKPFHFMDEIIRKVRKLKRCRMGDNDIAILCCTDAVLEKNEDDFQCLLYISNKTSKTFNMVTSAA